MDYDNSGKIYQTAMDYIEGLTGKDVVKLSNVLCREVSKKELKDNMVNEIDYFGTIDILDKGQIYNTSQVKIKILDVCNDFASLILESEFIELLQMKRIEQEWKIINILSYLNEKPEKDYEFDYLVETEHFVVSYMETEKKCIGTIVNLLENNYNLITEKFGKTLQQKTQVEICSNKEQLLTKLKIEDGPEWIRGGIVSGKTVIASPLNPPPGSDFYNVVNTVVHEFVHVIVEDINSNIPRWLNEGIASYEGRDNDENWIKETIKDGLKNKTIPFIKDLDTGNDFEKFFEKAGYQYSYTIVEFIVKKFGYPKLIQFIKNPLDYIGIFHMNEKNFESEWVHFIQVNY